MDAIILVGGLGTRLKSIVNDRPKPMAVIVNKPFLEYVLDLLIDAGIKNIIFAIGYKGSIIKDYFGTGENWGINIQYSYEKELLGTAGAIKNASNLIKSTKLLVLNGDTFFDVDFKHLFYVANNSKREMNILLRQVPDVSRYGQTLIEESKIIAFNEKNEKEEAGIINGGIYLMNSDLISSIPSGKISLEKNMIPCWINEGKEIGGIISNRYFIDIGIPEDYYRFCEDIIRQNEIYKNNLKKDIEFLLLQDEIAISSSMFVNWKQETKTILRKIYGVQSNQYKMFNHLKFEPDIVNINTDYRKVISDFCKKKLLEVQALIV